MTIARFREGWALKAMGGHKAHYFRRDGVSLARSLCGSQDAPAGWLNDIGHATCCERCAKLRDNELAKLPAKAPGEGQDARNGHRE